MVPWIGARMIEAQIGNQQQLREAQKAWMDGFKTFSSSGSTGLASLNYDTFTRSSASE